MVIVKIIGGLASQLQKYAFGRALSLKHGCELKLDLSWFESIPDGVTKREYMLGLYNIQASAATEKEIKRLKGHKYLLIDIANKMSHGLLFKKTYTNESYMNLNTYHKLGDEVYCEGEWFGANYYEPYKKELYQEMTLMQKLSATAAAYEEQIIPQHASVSLHVRRGDFITSSCHHVCDLSYFFKAVELMISRFENTHFYIFSDDLEWAKESFYGRLEQCTFIEHTQDYEELCLMSRCKHNIISNSGFSWLASWLNSNLNKMVIAPKQWYSDEVMNEKMVMSLGDNIFLI